MTNYQGRVTGPELRDVVLVLAAFWLPPLGVWGFLVLRSLHRLRQEMRSYRAEGYPPPDPPTTDSEPD